MSSLPMQRRKTSDLPRRGNKGDQDERENDLMEASRKSVPTRHSIKENELGMNRFPLTSEVYELQQQRRSATAPRPLNSSNSAQGNGIDITNTKIIEQYRVMQLLLPQLVNLEKRQVFIHQKFEQLQRESKYALTKWDISHQWQQFHNQVTREVEQKVRHTEHVATELVQGLAKQPDVTQALDDKASTMALSDLKRDHTHIKNMLLPLLEHPGNLEALIEGIEKTQNQNDKVSKLTQHLEALQFRTNSRLSEINLKVESMHQRFNDAESNLRTVKRDMLQSKTSQLYRQTATKTMTHLEGMNDITVRFAEPIEPQQNSSPAKTDSDFSLPEQDKLKPQDLDKRDQAGDDALKLLLSEHELYAWREANEIDLSVRRREFRNIFGYAKEFEDEYDPFGDASRAKGQEPPKGLFTPLKATRYLQLQVNDLCLALKKETGKTDAYKQLFIENRKKIEKFQDQLDYQQNELKKVKHQSDDLFKKNAENHLNWTNAQRGDPRIINSPVEDTSIVQRIEEVSEQVLHNERTVNVKINNVQEEANMNAGKTANVFMEIQRLDRLLVLEARHRRDLIQLVESQITPAVQLKLSSEHFRTKLQDSINSLEIRLQGAVVVLSDQIDQLRGPLDDAVQNIERERVAMEMEIKRQNQTHRNLILQTSNLLSSTEKLEQSYAQNQPHSSGSVTHRSQIRTDSYQATISLKTNQKKRPLKHESLKSSLYTAHTDLKSEKTMFQTMRFSETDADRPHSIGISDVTKSNALQASKEKPISVTTMTAKPQQQPPTEENKIGASTRPVYTVRAKQTLNQSSIQKRQGDQQQPSKIGLTSQSDLQQQNAMKNTSNQYFSPHRDFHMQSSITTAVVNAKTSPMQNKNLQSAISAQNLCELGSPESAQIRKVEIRKHSRGGGLGLSRKQCGSISANFNAHGTQISSGAQFVRPRSSYQYANKSINATQIGGDAARSSSPTRSNRRACVPPLSLKRFEHFN